MCTARSSAHCEDFPSPVSFRVVPEEMARCTDSWAVANGLAGWSGTWKDHNWKIGEKDIWGRSMWIDLSKWAKDVKIFVSHVNAHQKVTSAEEEFNNQVDKMTRSVDSQPLSPAIPVIAQWAHEQSGHGGRDGGYAWAQCWFLLLADLAISSSCSQVSLGE